MGHKSQIALAWNTDKLVKKRVRFISLRNTIPVLLQLTFPVLSTADVKQVLHLTYRGSQNLGPFDLTGSDWV